MENNKLFKVLRRFVVIVPFSYNRDQIYSIIHSYERDEIDGYNYVSSPKDGLIEAFSDFTTITNSSLEVKEGSLFVPLIAARDGHDYIIDSLNRGAYGFLYNKNHIILDSLTTEQKSKGIEVDNTWKALGILANYHRRRFHPHIIAITGSSGKTTAKEFFRYCLSTIPINSVVITEKNYNNEIGLPFTLFGINEDTTIVILEMGMNHRGEIEKLSKIAEPHSLLITTIGSAHIENLGSPEAIAWEKSDIIKGCRFNDSTPFTKSSKPVLYVPEDVAFREIIEKNTSSHSVSVKYWLLPEISSDSPFKLIEKNNKGYILEIQGHRLIWDIPGDKILSNLIGVITILLDLEFDISMILSGIKAYKPEGNRLRIESNGRFIIINDTYNANPESMQSSISITKQLSNGEDFLCVLGDMKELGHYSEFYHRQIGEYLYKSDCKYLLTYGDQSKFIQEEYLNNSPANVKCKSSHFEFGDIDQIISWIQDNISDGTTILIKGSRSMRMELIVEKILAIP